MLDKRAYTEAFYIINEMSDELKRKIPEEIIKNIECKMEKNYQFNIDDNIEDAELLEDTEKILSVLYTDYLSTEEEREIIKNKEKSLEGNEKISDIEIKEIFTKGPKAIEQENKDLVEISKNKWYTNIFKIFKHILSKFRK